MLRRILELVVAHFGKAVRLSRKTKSARIGKSVTENGNQTSILSRGLLTACTIARILQNNDLYTIDQDLRYAGAASSQQRLQHQLILKLAFLDAMSQWLSGALTALHMTAASQISCSSVRRCDRVYEGASWLGHFILSPSGPLRCGLSQILAQ